MLSQSDKFLEKLRDQFGRNWPNQIKQNFEKIKKRKSCVLYGLVAALVFSPIISSSYPLVSLQYLSAIFSGMAANILTNILAKLKKQDHFGNAIIIAESVQNSPELRDVIDLLLEKIEASKIIVSSTPENIRTLTINRFEDDLKLLGSKINISIYKKRTNRGRAHAKGSNSIAVGVLNLYLEQLGLGSPRKKKLVLFALLGFIVLLLVAVYIYDQNSYYIKVSDSTTKPHRKEIVLYKGHPKIQALLPIRETKICDTGIFDSDLTLFYQEQLKNNNGYLVVDPNNFGYMVRNLDLKIRLAASSLNMDMLLDFLKESYLNYGSEKKQDKDKIINAITILNKMDSELITKLSKLSFFEEVDMTAYLLKSLIKSDYDTPKLWEQVTEWAKSKDQKQKALAASLSANLYHLDPTKRYLSKRNIKSALEGGDPNVLIAFLLAIQEEFNSAKFLCDNDIYELILKQFSELGLSQERYEREYSVEVQKAAYMVRSTLNTTLSYCREYSHNRMLNSLKSIAISPTEENYKREIASDLIGLILSHYPERLNEFIVLFSKFDSKLEKELGLHIISEARIWNENVAEFLSNTYNNPLTKFESLETLCSVSEKSPDAEKVLVQYLDSYTEDELCDIFTDPTISFKVLYRTAKIPNIMRRIKSLIKDQNRLELIPTYALAVGYCPTDWGFISNDLSYYYNKSKSSEDKLLLLEQLSTRQVNCREKNMTREVRAIPFNEVIMLLRAYSDRHSMLDEDIIEIPINQSLRSINLRKTFGIIRNYDFFNEVSQFSFTGKQYLPTNESGNNRLLGLRKPYTDKFSSQLIGVIGKDTLDVVNELIFAIQNGYSIEIKYEAILALGNICDYRFFADPALRLSNDTIKEIAADQYLSKAWHSVLRDAFISFGRQKGIQACLQMLFDPHYNSSSAYRNAIISAIGGDLASKDDISTIKELTELESSEWHTRSAINEVVYRIYSRDISTTSVD